MSYSVEFAPTGIESLAGLAPVIQERILRKIRWMAEIFDDVSPQDLSADLSGLFKLRVGDYRFIYSFDAEMQCMTVHKVGHPRDVYD